MKILCARSIQIRGGNLGTDRADKILQKKRLCRDKTIPFKEMFFGIYLFHTMEEKKSY